MKYLVLLIGAILPTLAQAHTCDEVPGSEERLACYDRLGDCAAIESKDSRLACYETAAGAAEKRLVESVKDHNEEAAAQIDTKLGSTDLSDSQIRKDDEAFPVNPNEEAKQSPAPEIHSGIASIGASARGYVLLGLKNNQVWRLKEKSPFRFEEGRQVKIVEGFLGSTILVDVASGKRFKVKRER